MIRKHLRGISALIDGWVYKALDFFALTKKLAHNGAN
jgi:hypothetical protein